MTVSEILSEVEHDEEQEIMDALIHSDEATFFYCCGKYGLGLEQAEKLWEYK